MRTRVSILHCLQIIIASLEYTHLKLKVNDASTLHEIDSAGTAILLICVIKGAFHKTRPQSGVRGLCPVRTLCGKRVRGGSSNANVRTF